GRRLRRRHRHLPRGPPRAWRAVAALPRPSPRPQHPPRQHLWRLGLDGQRSPPRTPGRGAAACGARRRPSAGARARDPARQDRRPELQVHGRGTLIQTLLRHNLVDQYRLWVFPLVIGSGKRPFADGTIPSGLKLVDSKVSTTGVVIGTYEPAGEIVTGSFALD